MRIAIHKLLEELWAAFWAQNHCEKCDDESANGTALCVEELLEEGRKLRQEMHKELVRTKAKDRYLCSVPILNKGTGNVCRKM